jgi:pilus assembly protein TadC
MEAQVALFDYALALVALLGTLLVPFAVLYQVLRLKRRTVAVQVPAAPQKDQV